MYSVEVSHPGLHKHRIVRDRDEGIAWAKANSQREIWNEQWQRRLLQQAKADVRRTIADYKESRQQEAAALRQKAWARPGGCQRTATGHADPG